MYEPILISQTELSKVTTAKRATHIIDSMFRTMFCQQYNIYQYGIKKRAFDGYDAIDKLRDKISSAKSGIDLRYVNTWQGYIDTIDQCIEFMLLNNIHNESEE